MTELPLETLLEATLFSAGKSMTPGDFAESLGYDEDEIIEAMTNLQSTLKRRKGGALQVLRLGGDGLWK